MKNFAFIYVFMLIMGSSVAAEVCHSESTRSRQDFNTYTDHGAAGNSDVVVDAARFPEYLREANEGDDESMRLVAICYMTGTGVEKDFNQAWRWLGRSAKAGNATAEYDIATLFHDGYGVAQNYEESAYWYRKAASNGNVKAMAAIARQFELGLGVQQDYRIAAEYYWRAAERGDGESALKYAVMLRDGVGVGADRARAEKWFEKAEELGAVREKAYPETTEENIKSPSGQFHR